MPKTLFEINNVSYRYPGADEDVLRNISFTIPEGGSTAIVGVSGRGKSTLLRMLAGLERPREGVILWKGQQLNAPAKEIGIVFQNYSETIFDWLTVLDNMLLAEPIRPRARVGDAINLAQTLGIKEKLHTKAQHLSGGQRQRVAIARTLLQRAELVLLDEPFSSLDTLARHDLIRTLRHLSRAYQTTFVIVSHDIEEAIAATQRVFCLLHHTEIPQLVVIDWKSEAVQASSEMLHVYAVIRQRAERILGILREDRGRNHDDPDENDSGK
jgi:ABC-type nitrate/sulfonate/bicarbonate transport system ATPase subunit